MSQAKDSPAFVGLPTRRKLAQLVPYHLGCNTYWHVLLAVVHEEPHSKFQRREGDQQRNVGGYTAGELFSAGERAAAHPIKLGRTVQDRADVRMGAFDRSDSAMLGNEVKKGPSHPGQARTK